MCCRRILTNTGVLVAKVATLLLIAGAVATMIVCAA